MALSKKQTKSKEQADKISEMRKEVLKAIKRNEMEAGLGQPQTQEERDELKEDKPLKIVYKKKKIPIIFRKIDKKESILAVKPKASKKIFTPKKADNVTVGETKKISKKEVIKKGKTGLKPKNNILTKPKPCFFCPKTIQQKEPVIAKETDQIKKIELPVTPVAKLDTINSIVRKEKEPQKSSGVAKVIILFFVGLIFGFLFFAALIFYIPKSESLLARKVSNFIPLPAIIINGKIINYKDYLKEVDTVDLFLLRQQRLGIIRELPAHTQVRKEVKDLLIKQEIINSLANQYKISVSQKEIDEEIQKIKDQSRSSESFDDVLKNLYGWSEADFGNKVIRNYLLISKLSNKMFPDVSDDESKDYLDKKIEEIKKGMNIYVLVE